GHHCLRLIGVFERTIVADISCGSSRSLKGSDEYHIDIAAVGANPLRKLEPADPSGTLRVGQQDMNLDLAELEDGASFLCGGGLDHPVPAGAEVLGDDHADDDIPVHQENGLVRGVLFTTEAHAPSTRPCSCLFLAEQAPHSRCDARNAIGLGERSEIRGRSATRYASRVSLRYLPRPVDGDDKRACIHRFTQAGRELDLGQRRGPPECDRSPVVCEDACYGYATHSPAYGPGLFSRVTPMRR